MKKDKYIEVPVIVLKTKSGYNAFSPTVDGCVSTAKTVDTVLKRMKEALEFHLEGEALVKGKARKATTVLKNAFDEYDTDALYASLKVASNF